MKIPTNIHVGTLINDIVGQPQTQELTKIPESILWDSTGYVEFTIKSAEHFNITWNLYATHI